MRKHYLGRKYDLTEENMQWLIKQLEGTQYQVRALNKLLKKELIYIPRMYQLVNRKKSEKKYARNAQSNNTRQKDQKENNLPRPRVEPKDRDEPREPALPRGSPK